MKPNHQFAVEYKSLAYGASWARIGFVASESEARHVIASWKLGGSTRVVRVVG